MAKIRFTKKFKLVTFLLSILMLLVSFAGCTPPVDPQEPGGPVADVVGSQINYVNNVYHEVYVEEGLTESDKGLVVGLHDSAMEILSSADKIYDGSKEVFLINGRIKGLNTKALGSENNFLTIEKGGEEYTLKYMYVTRAIRTVNDLSENRDQFPTAAWINPSQHPEGLSKYTPYIFEMDMESLNYSAGRWPTIEVSGYYVLAADIDIGGTAYGTVPGNKVDNVIKAGHSDYRPNAAFLKKTDVGFTGTFDGRGHKLENISTWKGGLFGYINGGTIKNTAFIGACNYWQNPDSHIFADYLNNASFENLYVTLKQQGLDNGSYNPNNPGGTYYYEYWCNIFGDGTLNAKNCVLESFILEGEATKNTNNMQFLNISSASTYQNVHCVGSSPLGITSYDFSDGVKVMVTEKELVEFERDYGDVFPALQDSVGWTKYYHLMTAVNESVDRDNGEKIEDVHLVPAPSGVEKYDTIALFNKAMKNEQDSIQAFMDTGCWNYDATTGALTWKTK